MLAQTMVGKRRGNEGRGKRKKGKKNKKEEKEKKRRKKEKKKKKRGRKISLGVFGFSKPNFILFSIFRNKISFFAHFDRILFF